MRHQQASRASAADLFAQHRQHPRGGVGVEIAGGLVGQDQARRVHHRARDGHALQLPARQLRRKAPAQPVQAHVGQQFLDALRIGPPQQAQRQFHVLGHRQMRQHMEGLEHKAQPGPAQPRAAVVAECVQRGAVDEHLPAVGAVEPGNAVQQRRLADARLTQQRREFPAAQHQRHGVENRRVAERFTEVVDVQHVRLMMPDRACRPQLQGLWAGWLS